MAKRNSKISNARRKTEGSRADTWAAIDIGRATVHLLVGAIEEQDSGAIVRHIENRATLFDLGTEVAEEGGISDRSAKRLRATVGGYVKVARRFTDNVTIGATEASRSATNRREILGGLSESIGYPVHVLSARREAQLGFLGVQSSLPLEGCQVVVNSGGASTEVSVTDGHRLIGSISVPVGAAALAAGMEGDPPSPLTWALQAVKLGKALKTLPKADPTGMWATGVSADNLVGRDRSRRPPRTSSLSMSKLDRSSRELLQKRSKEISKQTGEDPRRAKLLAAGALILGAVMQHYGATQCTVLAPGVRDGMILAARNDPEKWSNSAPVGRARTRAMSSRDEKPTARKTPAE